MTTTTKYLQQLNYLKNNLVPETSKIVYANEVEIIALNTEDQLHDKGVNIFGGALGNYANNYKAKSNSLLKGYPKTIGKRYNFLDTGRLYNDMELRVEGTKLIIYNTDTGNKLGHLLELTGAPFIGLTKENEQVLNYDIIYPELMDFINKYI